MLKIIKRRFKCNMRSSKAIWEFPVTVNGLAKMQREIATLDQCVCISFHIFVWQCSDRGHNYSFWTLLRKYFSNPLYKVQMFNMNLCMRVIWIVKNFAILFYQASQHQVEKRINAVLLCSRILFEHNIQCAP